MWPDKIRCPVSLGFDVDGVSGAINRNPKTRNLPSLMSMREYGPSVAMPRILDLLDDYGIKASFFVPGFIAETHIELIEDLVLRGHEIGHHGYMHEPPATLNKEEEAEVLDRGTAILKKITGNVPAGYRSPSWELSNNSLQLLHDRGFEYDSSLMGNDIPYIVNAGSGSIVEVPIHWELDDHPFFNYSPYLGQTNVAASPRHVFEIWSAAFEGLYNYRRSFVLTMHPWIIGRPGRLEMLRQLVEHIKAFDGAEFMTLLDLVHLYRNNI